MPAATKSEWTTYLPEIKVTVDATDFTFPIWNLSLTVVPWTGISGPAQELADGNRRQKVRGWHVVMSFDMEFGQNMTDHGLATRAIKSMYEFGSGIFDFDPVDNAGSRVLTMTIQDASDFMVGSIVGKIRSRKVQATFITKTVIATGSIPSWIAGDI